jgi:hypothetical protein
VKVAYSIRFQVCQDETRGSVSTGERCPTSSPRPGAVDHAQEKQRVSHAPGRDKQQVSHSAAAGIPGRPLQDLHLNEQTKGRTQRHAALNPHLVSHTSLLLFFQCNGKCVRTSTSNGSTGHGQRSEAVGYLTNKLSLKILMSRKSKPSLFSFFRVSIWCATSRTTHDRPLGILLEYRVESSPLRPHQDLGVLEDGPRDGYPLALPSTEDGPLLAHLRIIPRRQGQYELLRVGCSRSVHDLRPSGSRTRVRNVVRDAAWDNGGNTQPYTC